MVTPGYWSGKNVLVTGHTGFKGTWLCHWLSQMSADVVGYALAPMTPSSMFETITLVDRDESIIADINDREKLEQVISRVKPDVIFHLAAQALVRASYGNPMETFETNVMGTANLLQALCSLEHHCDVVIVTSDKCYLNKERSCAIGILPMTSCTFTPPWSPGQYINRCQSPAAAIKSLR